MKTSLTAGLPAGSDIPGFFLETSAFNPVSGYTG